LHYSDITLKASFHHTPATVRRAFTMIASGKFKADKFLTGRAPLQQLKPVLDGLMERSNEIKTVIDPWQT
jgi:L-iditol 2-dehydrogenase